MSALSLIGKIDQKLSFILGTLIGRKYDDNSIAEKDVKEAEAEVKALTEQAEAEAEIAQNLCEEIINESDQIALISAVNVLSNFVLIEYGYFDGAEFTKDEVDEMALLDNEDLVILSEYKEQAAEMLKELLGDIDDGEYVDLAFTKLEEVTTNE